MKWEKARISDVCEVTGGTTPSTRVPEYWDGDVTWLSPVDLPAVGTIVEVSDSQRKVTAKALADTSLRMLPVGSVVYSTRASIGKIGHVVKPLVTNQGFTNMIPGPRINNRYLAYALKHFTPQIELLGNSTTFNEVSRTAIKNFKLPLPPLATQQRITDTLDTADALRRKDQELLRKYDELAQSIFYEMFGDPMQNTMKWPIKGLGSFARNKSDLVDGPFGSSVDVKKDYIAEGEIPVIRTKNVGLLSFKEDDLKFMTREKFMSVYRSNVQANDLVITKVGTIGNVCEFPSHLGEGVLSTTGSCRLRVDDEAISRKYMLYHLLYQRKYLNQIASEGVQPFLNMTHIKGIPIMCPPRTTQDKFASLVSNFETSKKLLNDQAENSLGLFNNLLHTYFS